MIRTILYLALFLLIFPASGQAAELYGLAMHGEPKYGPDATHLSYANPEAPKGGTLRQAAANGTFDTLNPYSLKGTAAQGLNLAYDRLMARVWDEPFTMYPLIAEKIEVPEDRSAITFHINPKARFHDGSPITADDVIFSFITLKEQGRPNMRRIYRLVDKIEKLGPLTVHFELGPDFDQETIMILAMMPVLSKAWWEGRDFNATVLESPLLNGPYRIADVDPGRRIVYERVEDYWAKDLLPNKGHFNFDRIFFDYYRDDTVAIEAFKAGNLDLRREWNAGKWATAYDFPAVQSGEVIAEPLPHARPERVRSLIYNARRIPFDNRAVREASETRPALGSQACERLVGSCTDSDVVGMPEDAVGAERHDNSGLLLLKDPSDRRDNVIEGKIRDATIRQTQPLVTVRDATECSPGGFILSLADGPKRLSCGRESVSDVPLLAEGGVNQDEPEVWLIRVQRDTARLLDGVGRLGLEVLRDVVEHEPPTLGVRQDAAVAPQLEARHNYR